MRSFVSRKPSGHLTLALSLFSLCFFSFSTLHFTGEADGLLKFITCSTMRSAISLFYLARAIIGSHCYWTAFSVAFWQTDEKSSIIHTVRAACGWSVENRVHLTPPDSDSITQKAGGNQAAGKWLLNKFPPPTAARGHIVRQRKALRIIYCISHRVHFLVPPERQKSICNFNKCKICHSFSLFCSAWMKNEQNAT